MDTRQQDAGQMITALRDGLHGLHLARMMLVEESKALRLAGRRTERDRVWARVEEITAQIEVSNKELAEHMLRAEAQAEKKTCPVDGEECDRCAGCRTTACEDCEVRS